MRPAVCLTVLALAPLWAAEDPRTFFNQGVEHQRAGRLVEARAAYERSLELDSRHIGALSNLGLICLKLGEHDRAAERLAAAIALDPNQHDVRVFLALALFSASRWDDAAAELDRVLKAQPANPRALHLRGLIYLKKGELEVGAGLLEKTLQAAPNNRDAAITLATAYIGLKDIAKAEAAMSRIPQPHGPELALLRGGMLSAKGQHGLAVEQFNIALRANPSLPTARAQLGVAYMMQGEHARAMEELRAELRLHPDDYTANANLGLLYVQEKRYEEAGVLLRKARVSRPRDPGLLYLTAQVDAAGGRHEDAARSLEEVVKARPEFIPAYVLLARTYAKLKRPQDAAALQARVRKLTQEEQQRNLASTDSYSGKQAAAP